MARSIKVAVLLGWRTERIETGRASSVVRAAAPSPSLSEVPAGAEQGAEVETPAELPVGTQ